MVSDLLLPGLAAQILTLPYNPNNVSDDAAPITIDLRLFPSARVHVAIAALGQTDSIAIDPHKLGYIPYGAGALRRASRATSDNPGGRKSSA